MADDKKTGRREPAVCELNLGSVGRMRGGLVGAQFQRLLSDAIHDCNDRPGNTSARTVTLKLKLTPKGETAVGEKIAVEAEMTATRPSMCIEPHEMRVRKKRDPRTQRDEYTAVMGGDPEDADQMTLDDGAE